MITKFKLFETTDVIMYNNIYIDYTDDSAYPFLITMEFDKVYFGPVSDTHDYVRDNKGHRIESDCRGRIWVKYKVISFWQLYTKNMINILEIIQISFNNSHDEHIDFFDGEWKIDIHDNQSIMDDSDSREKYKEFDMYEISDSETPNAFRSGCEGVLVPIEDFLRINGNEAEIEENDEEYQQHLAKIRNKK